MGTLAAGCEPSEVYALTVSSSCCFIVVLVGFTGLVDTKLDISCHASLQYKKCFSNLVLRVGIPNGKSHLSQASFLHLHILECRSKRIIYGNR